MASNDFLINKWLRMMLRDQTQKEIATALGISPQYLSDILKGRRPISEEFGQRIGFELIWRRKK